MKRVLLTGGTGFIGRNIKPYLETVCELFSPSRKELNLYNEEDVRNYIINNKIDVIVHSANPNPVKNTLDKQETMFEDSIRIFMNLYNSSEYYEMMYFLGSGAEYDKSKDISTIKEDDEFRSVPYDSYGLAKFTINQLIARSKKVCNLRVFACYGPTDHESKFITHVVNCCLDNRDITIRQNCYFDYMHVSDLAKIIGFFINIRPKYRSYNVCSGERISLYEIATKVKSIMKTTNNIVVLSDGLNREYTASNERLISELGSYEYLSLEDGIKIQIESERINRK